MMGHEERLHSAGQRDTLMQKVWPLAYTTSMRDRVKQTEEDSFFRAARQFSDNGFPFALPVLRPLSTVGLHVL